MDQKITNPWVEAQQQTGFDFYKITQYILMGLGVYFLIKNISPRIINYLKFLPKSDNNLPKL